MKSTETALRKGPTLLAALLLASLAVPAAADRDRDGVTLFQDVHFRGQYETFAGDIANLRRTYFGNDCASSIAVPRGCQVTLYRDADFRGASVTLDHDVADLRYTRIGNDEVSSLSVSCYGDRRGRRWDRGGRHDDRRYEDHGYDENRYDGPRDRDRRYQGDHRRRGGGVTLYSDAGFRGRYETIDHDDRNLRDNAIGNDAVSSIEVAPGCRAVLYSNSGFRGTTLVLTESYADLRHSAIGNDRVSSIRVDCGRW